MHVYIVQLTKREVIELTADVEIVAASEEEARTRAIHQVEHVEIDDRLWIERDSFTANNAIKIENVRLASGTTGKSHS